MVHKSDSKRLQYNLTPHFKKHTSDHNRVMRREIVRGKSADEAHKIAQKNVGK